MEALIRGEVPVIFLVKFVVALGILGVAWKRWSPGARRFFRFLDAFEGYTGSDGKHVPGVLERLTRVEETAAAAASSAAASNEKVDHVSEQVSEVRDELSEVKSSLADVRDQGQALAAEQTQIRTALEELRAQGTDAPTLPIPPTPQQSEKDAP